MAANPRTLHLISHRQSVRPTKCDGASKRACELLVQAAAARNRHRSGSQVARWFASGKRASGPSGFGGALVREQMQRRAAHSDPPEITRYFRIRRRRGAAGRPRPGR